MYMCLREAVCDTVSFISEQRQWTDCVGADDKSVSILTRNILIMCDFVTLEDGTDRLSRNVSNLPIYAALISQKSEDQNFTDQ